MTHLVGTTSHYLLHPHHAALVMGCCAEEATGLCLFLLLSTLVFCQEIELIWSFWFHKYSNFTPAPIEILVSIHSCDYFFKK